MEIGGLQKVTLIDYPGKIAATVFTIGCNFRCPWCYSSELVLPEKIKDQPRLSEADLFNFLREKRGLLDGVVICGGEPTIHQDLPDFVQKIKKLGFLVKLDTNGSHTEALRGLIEKELIDYVAMDVKAPKEKYSFYSGINCDTDEIERSIHLLKKGKVDYEFRTTVAPGLTKKDIFDIVRWIAPAKGYFLQEINLQKELIEPKIKKFPLISREELQKIISKIKSSFELCQLR